MRPPLASLYGDLGLLLRVSAGLRAKGHRGDFWPFVARSGLERWRFGKATGRRIAS